MTAKSVFFLRVMRKVDKHPLYLFVFRETDGLCCHPDTFWLIFIALPSLCAF